LSDFFISVLKAFCFNNLTENKEKSKKNKIQKQDGTKDFQAKKAHCRIHYEQEL